MGSMFALLQELTGGSLTVLLFERKVEKSGSNDYFSEDFKGSFHRNIHFSDENFLYASNRGEANTISTFRILKNGKLESKGQTSSLGKGEILQLIQLEIFFWWHINIRMTL
jgi:6-phosphogluconolactonase